MSHLYEHVITTASYGRNLRRREERREEKSGEERRRE
jgi:hypothetical protein